MGGFADLQNLAQEYLDACVEALADTPDGAPGVAFVSPGPPSWDCCPQLSVHINVPAIADTYPLQPSLAPAHRIARQGQVLMIGMVATVLRCDPMVGNDGNVPVPEEMTAAAAQVNADMWAIWNFINRAKRLNLLWGPKEREVAWDPAIAQKQQGGCCGWEIPIRVQLDGYVPDSLAS